MRPGSIPRVSERTFLDFESPQIRSHLSDCIVAFLKDLTSLNNITSNQERGSNQKVWYLLNVPLIHTEGLFKTEMMNTLQYTWISIIYSSRLFFIVEENSPDSLICNYFPFLRSRGIFYLMISLPYPREGIKHIPGINIQLCPE